MPQRGFVELEVICLGFKLANKWQNPTVVFEKDFLSMFFLIVLPPHLSNDKRFNITGLPNNVLNKCYEVFEFHDDWRLRDIRREASCIADEASKVCRSKRLY